MNPSFNYSLSYFRPNQESSLDIQLNTNNQEINGFQLIVDIEAQPALQIIDQSKQVEHAQLSISNDSQLNFLTNRIEPTEKGYQLVLAGITSNPKAPLKTAGQPTTIASLIFTQPSQGEIFIIPNNQRTKISTVTSASQDMSAFQPVNILTKEVGSQPNIMTGQIYITPSVVKSHANVVPTPPISSPSPVMIYIFFAVGVLATIIFVLLNRRLKRLKAQKINLNQPTASNPQAPFPNTPPQPPGSERRTMGEK